MYASVGEVAMTAMPAVWNQAILGIEPYEGMRKRFLGYVLRAAREHLVSQARSNTQANLNAEQVGNLRIPMPPLRVQQAIADYLDRETAEIDAFIADQERLIELLAERLRSEEERLIFGLDIEGVKTESGLPWVPAVPAMWGMARIGDHYEVQLGKMLDQAKHGTGAARELPYVRAANIRERRLDLSDVNSMPFEPAEIARFDLRAGDLLVVEGGSVGTNVTLESGLDGWAFQKTVNRVRSRGRGHPQFLGLILDAYRRAGAFDILAGKSTIQHLTAEKLRGLRVPAPPLGEQVARFEQANAAARDVNAAIADAREAIALSKERRAALISAAVIGKIDVAGPRS